jgi:hypothetical protein
MLAMLAVGLLLPTLALAQNAKVYGTVYDVKGNAYPRVIVELQNPSTGVKRAALTDDDGNYSFAEVPPAEGYTITATAGGRVLAQQTGLAVRVGDEKLLIPPLQETAPSTAPEEERPKAVAAAGPSVTNEITPAISTVITSEQLQSLPVYNRNFLAFGLLNPNAHDVEAGSPLAGATFSLAGARPSSNNFLLDGADNVASSSNQAIPFQVNDSIQEFRVTATNANAEFGRNAGGVVNVVTRRAYTGFHGKMFGYFGSDRMNSDNPLSIYRNSGFEKAAAFAGPMVPTAAIRPAKPPGALYNPPLTVTDYNTYVATARANGFCTDSITNYTLAPSTCVANGFGRNTLFNPGAVLAGKDSFKQPFSSQQFGGSMGGGLKRLYLFSSYEGTRIDNPNPIFERVPSAIDKNPPTNITGLDVTSQQLAQGMLALYPNANVVAVPGVLEFYQGTAPNYTKVDNLLLRGDFLQSANTDWIVRYSVQRLNQLHDDTLPVNRLYPGNGAIRHALNQSMVVTYSHRFGKAANEFRVGASRFQVIEKPQDGSFDPTTLGLPAGNMWTFLLSGLDTRYSGARKGVAGAYAGWYNAFWNSAIAPNAMAPSLDGLFPFARIGAPLSAPGERRDTTAFASEALSVSLGRHSFKFGGEYRRLENLSYTGGFSRGLVVASDIGEFTSDSETCNDLGLCNGFTTPSFDYAWRQRAPYDGVFTSYAVAGFAQDSWRINSHLLVSYGVRYEFFSVPVEDHHLVWNFDPTANGLYRENSNTVVDPYGYNCALGYARADSIYAAHAAPSPWNCSDTPTHGGGILPERTRDIAPRFGFVYSVDRQSRTVIRGSIGYFNDQLPLSTMSQLLFNRPTPVNYANPEAFYGQNFATSICNTAQCGLGNAALEAIPPIAQSFQSAAIPFAIYGRDYEHAKTPYSRQISGSLQQQITNKLTMELGYIGTRGYHLPIVYNAGFSNEWFCTTTPNCDTISFFPVFMMTNQGTSRYHSGMARLRAANWHGLTMNVGYSFSKSMDNGSQGTFPLLLTTLPIQVFGLQAFGVGNPVFLSFGARLTGAIPGLENYPSTSVSANLSDLLISGLTTTGASQIVVSRYNIPQDPLRFLTDEYGKSDFNVSHRAVVDYSWNLPFRKDSKLLSNWQVSGIVTVQSGQPFTVFSGPAYGEVMQRANAGAMQMTGNPNSYMTGSVVLPGTACRANPVSRSLYVTGAALFDNTLGQPCIGTSARNAFTGPAFMSTDVAIQKTFIGSTESRRFIIRAEIFNLLNRANYYNPISAASNDGVTANPQFGQVMSAHEPRQIQLSLRFTW